MTGQRTNWAGNVVFGAREVHKPASVAELQRLVAGSARIRALGTAHSFSLIADTPGGHVSVVGLPRLIEMDTDRATVRVSAGLTYAGLAPYLHARGFALRNMASLPHISVAGACATGTHGSGNTTGNLATAVSAIEMVTASGDLVTLSRASNPAEFPGAVVALGALGVVVSLTLDVVPAFMIRQYTYENLPRDQVDAHLNEIFAAGYSVSLFTDWASQNGSGARVRQAWLKKQVTDQDPGDAEAAWYSGRLADGPRHPVPGMPAEFTTAQQGVPGPWHERLPHFRPEFTPSAGAELQSEYLLPRELARDALAAISQISDRLAPLVQISEIRTVAADDLWLSPSYQRDTVAIHFTWIDDARAVTNVLPLVEGQLAPYGARPHWGKLFAVSQDLIASRYDRLPDFQRLRQHYDPNGKFRNEFTDRYISGDI
jgi:alditol oxidase